MSRLKPIGLACALALLATSPCFATVRNVPADHPTIQAALNASTSGDVVLVAPGVYHENLVIGSARNGVRLASVAGPATTTIDGGRAGAVLTISNVGVGTEVEGFTITNGGTNPPYNFGGGAYLSFANATLRGNVIRGNFANGGAGLYVDRSSPVLVNNQILDNDAVYGSGGGIYFDHFSNATVSGNVIARNRSAAYGGGITIWDGSSPHITGNTIVSNTGLLGGGGIFVNRNSHPQCDRNIVSHNPVGGGITVFDFESTVQLSCNDVFGNSPAGYAGVPDPTGTNGNIALDPQFCDLAALNVSLSGASPCVDIHAPAGCGQIGARGVGCAAPPAVVRHVPADYPTIQAALNASTAGNVILVAPGVYHENLVIGGAQNGVRLASTAGPAATTIDGSRAGRVLTISNVGSGMEVEGFTITNGGANPPYDFGGGAYLSFANATLRGNVIRGNFAAGGAGLYVDRSSPVLVDNQILDNDAVYGSGGGIYFDHFSNATVSGNVIARNRSAAYGGGITIWDGSSPHITGNTIVSNTGTLGGGGIFVNHNSHPQCDRNIVSHNPVGGGITVFDFESTIQLSCNDVFGNSPGGYAGVPDPTGTNGNIALDPLFCDLAALDVSLNDASPCLDTHAPAGCGQIGARSVGCGGGPAAIEVHLDIQPAKCPNRVNLRIRDQVKAAIVGTAALDVNDIDIASLRLNGAQPQDSRLKDAATPFVGPPCGCTTREADGIEDLVLWFDTHALAASLDLDSRREEVTLELTGNLKDGTPIAGSDCILMIRRSGGRGQIVDLYSATSTVGAAQRIEYELHASAPVHLAVYDAAGRLVRSLVNASEETGVHSRTWEAGGLPNGIYFYRLRAAEEVVTRKFVLAR